MLIIALMAATASLLPAAGSFVPRDSGNLLFGDVAQAACKWNGKPGPGSLTNRFERFWGWAYVRTGWCYSGGNVTDRHSATDYNTTVLGSAWRYVKLPGGPDVQYSMCHAYNGYSKHNCLTRFQFKFWNITQGIIDICIHTRIYGNGAHSRLITTGFWGNCETWDRYH